MGTQCLIDCVNRRCQDPKTLANRNRNEKKAFDKTVKIMMFEKQILWPKRKDLKEYRKMFMKSVYEFEEERSHENILLGHILI